jgi:hypothetical protein
MIDEKHEMYYLCAICCEPVIPIINDGDSGLYIRRCDVCRDAKPAGSRDLVPIPYEEWARNG